MKINLIRVNSVHSKENSGILPRVSLSNQLRGQRAWGLEPGGPELEFRLSLSCITTAQLSKGRKCHCLTELLCGSTRKDIKAMKPLMDIEHSASFPLVPHRLKYPPGGLLGHLRRRTQDLSPAPPDPAPSSRGGTLVWGWEFQGGRFQKPCHT